jgi:hypothetical protein
MADTITTKAPVSSSIPSATGGYYSSMGESSTGPGPSANSQAAIITVQPAKHSDLQPSYAQILEPDPNDVSTTSWYGAMSRHHPQCMVSVDVC